MRGAFSTRWVRGGALWSAVGGALSGPLGWEEPQDGQCLGRVPSGCLEKKVCSGVGERTVVAGRWASLDHMSHVALTGRGDGLTEKTEACGGTRDAGLATTGCACCLLTRGPRRQWSRCGAWRQGSGNVALRCLETPGETPRGQLDVQQSGQGWRDRGAMSIQGESQVCVEELTWRPGVRGEACRLVPAGRVGVQRRNLPRRPGHQASSYLQMAGNRADRIKLLSLRFSSL